MDNRALGFCYLPVLNFSPSPTVISQAFIQVCISAAQTLRPSSSPPARISAQEEDPHEPPSEADAFYAGLPSAPRLVWRSGGSVWTAPTTYHRAKVLRDVGEHPIKDVWEDNLALSIIEILKKAQVDWTSLDLVRIPYTDESPTQPTPPVIWIGVTPSSLSRDDAAHVGSLCVALLSQNKLADVEVHFRESVVTRGAGPKFLKPGLDSNPTASIQEPLTTTLGIPICAKSTQHIEGTGGFFIGEGGGTKRRLLVTDRHVVLPPTEVSNAHFERGNSRQRHHDVILFGSHAFFNFIAVIQTAIGDEVITVQRQEKRLARLEGQDGEETEAERTAAHQVLETATKKMEGLNDLYQKFTTLWITPECRILGQVILAPPIAVGAGLQRYTRDWAIIEMEASKFDSDNFIGNVIDLGTELTPGQFTRKMYPCPANPHSFEYPEDRLLRLQRVMTDDEMRHPVDEDTDGVPCRIVIKRGNTTGLTFGRATTVVAYTRYHVAGVEVISKEWSVLPYDRSSGAFSDGGDSGSVVADGCGCIVGLLTGGSGAMDSTDITYITPAAWLLQDIANHGIHEPNVAPALTFTA